MAMFLNLCPPWPIFFAVSFVREWKSMQLCSALTGHNTLSFLLRCCSCVLHFVFFMVRHDLPLNHQLRNTRCKEHQFVGVHKYLHNFSNTNRWYCLNSSACTHLVFWWASCASLQKYGIISMPCRWSACTTTWMAQGWPDSARRHQSQRPDYGLGRTVDIQYSAEWFRQLHLSSWEQPWLWSYTVYTHCARWAQL